MDLDQRLAISYYKPIAAINEPHHVYLVQHQETKKIAIKKVLDVYNLAVYAELYRNPVAGTPRIINYYEDAGKLTVIEEYISGTSLQDKISHADIAPNDMLQYMLDLCAILEQLHLHNPAIIHRDVKPSNVIITSYNRAVLLDFNAAKYHTAAKDSDTILLGTQGYAAPEQYGFGQSSQQTDIYSMGILLKEMAEASHCQNPYIDAVTAKCTQMNPAERYQSIGELRQALLANGESFLIHMPVKSPPEIYPVCLPSVQMLKHRTFLILPQNICSLPLPVSVLKHLGRWRLHCLPIYFWPGFAYP